jgi:hypothetical protein
MPQAAPFSTTIWRTRAPNRIGTDRLVSSRVIAEAMLPMPARGRWKPSMPAASPVVARPHGVVDVTMIEDQGSR